MKTLFTDHSGRNNSNSYVELESTTFKWNRHYYCIHCLKSALCVQAYLKDYQRYDERDDTITGYRCSCMGAIREMSKLLAFQVVTSKLSNKVKINAPQGYRELSNEKVQHFLKGKNFSVYDLKSGFDIRYPEISARFLTNSDNKYNIARVVRENHYGMSNSLLTFLFCFRIEYKILQESTLEDLGRLTARITPELEFKK